MLHVPRGRLSTRADEPAWVRSLEGVAVAPPGGIAEDQLGYLRERAKALSGAPAPSTMPGGVLEGALDDENKGDKKAKKKRKKEKKEEDRTLVGKRPSRAVQKAFQDMYAGTGLDQRERVRRRVERPRGMQHTKLRRGKAAAAAVAAQPAHPQRIQLPWKGKACSWRSPRPVAWRSDSQELWPWRA